MDKLATDALNLIRLRFYAKPSNYHYSPTVLFAVLLCLGAIDALALAQWISGHFGMITLVVGLSFFKWVSFSLAANRILLPQVPPTRLKIRPQNAAVPGTIEPITSAEPPLEKGYTGYVLLGEALSLPTFLALIVPWLAPFTLLWQLWSFVAYTIGLMRLSGYGLMRVLLSYLFGALLFFFCTSLLIALFSITGWIDAPQMSQIFLQMQQEMINQPQP